jgi:hypothetical protein
MPVGDTVAAVFTRIERGDEEAVLEFARIIGRSIAAGDSHDIALFRLALSQLEAVDGGGYMCGVLETLDSALAGAQSYLDWKRAREMRQDDPVRRGGF